MSTSAGSASIDRRRADPTGTKPIRERFVSDLRGRFRRIRGLIRATVGYENDALGLSANAEPPERIPLPRDETPPSVVVQGSGNRTRSYVRADRSDAPRTVITWILVDVPRRSYSTFHRAVGNGIRANAEPADVFDFPSDPQKRRAFEKWLQQALDDEVLEPPGMIQLENGEHYTGPYTRSSYTRALADAEKRLRETGVAIGEAEVATVVNAPIHEKTLETIYTRTYSNLEDITDDAADTISEELARGIAEGENPRAMARTLNDEVQTITRTRAEVLARTETINAYTESTLTRFEQLGVGQVTVEAEWQTAGDNRVCPICQVLAGRTFTTTEAREGTFTFDASGEDVADSLAGEYPIRPPAHPQCRCSLIPA